MNLCRKTQVKRPKNFECSDSKQKGVTLYRYVVGHLIHLSPKKFGGPKTSNFRRDFGQLRDVIANISGLE